MTSNLPHKSRSYRHITPYCANRQHADAAAIHFHLFVPTFASPDIAQDDTYHKTNISSSVEAHTCDFWAFGMGAECCCGARQSVVCYWGRGPSDQSVGLGLGRVEAFFDGSHFYRKGACGIIASPLSVQLRRGQGGTPFHHLLQHNSCISVDGQMLGLGS